MDLVPATRPTAGKAYCSLQRSIFTSVMAVRLWSALEHMGGGGGY
jgi:hypothetical protein